MIHFNCLKQVGSKFKAILIIILKGTLKESILEALTKSHKVSTYRDLQQVLVMQLLLVTIRLERKQGVSTGCSYEY